MVADAGCHIVHLAGDANPIVRSFCRISISSRGPRGTVRPPQPLGYFTKR